ncbi:MAG: ribosome-associated translation inhibitor RaiA [Anaerohalosphaeraceae bacterium]|nr:ribosome-associated translation inhibitor RaiA [Anaerohalosphaeraceae bacterium]
MEITFSAKHIELTDAIRILIEDKVARLPKFYNSLNGIEVVLDGSEGGGSSVEIIARAEHSRVFVAKEVGADMYACVDEAVRKVERQLSRHKEKERDNKHSGSPNKIPMSDE